MNCQGIQSCRYSNLSVEESVITMNCNGNKACQSANIVGKGDLNLECTINGNASCASMNINMMTNKTQTLKCGDKESDSAYACDSLSFSTTANSLNVDCYEMGCNGTTVKTMNPVSTLNLDCSSKDACVGAQVIANGNFDYQCAGDYSCRGLQVTTTQNKDQNVICKADHICESLQWTASGGLSIECDGESACYKSSFIAANTSINCVGNQTCSNGMVQSMTANINCNATGSNETMPCPSMFIATTKALSMTCAGMGSCKSSNLSIDGEAKLICESNDSCGDMTVILPANFNNGFFQMNGSQKGSCDDFKFKCAHPTSRPSITDFIWDKQLNKYQCANSECCPWDSSKPPYIPEVANGTLTCERFINNKTGMCNINGSNVTTKPQNPWYPKYDISFLSLDASMAKELNLECATKSTCSNTNVQGASSESNINCNAEDACLEATISGLKSETTNINCINSASCHYMKVKDVTGKGQLYCNSGGNAEVPCVSIDYTAPTAKEVDIKCIGSSMGSACSDLIVHAGNVGKLSLEAYVEIDGIDWVVHGANATNVEVLFDGLDALWSGTFDFSNVKALNVTLAATEQSNGIDDIPLIYGPSGGLFDLTCKNYGCYYGNFETDNGLSDINVTFTGCNCTDLNDCVNAWELTCDGGKTNEFVNGECRDQEGNCCDANDETRITNDFDRQLSTCPSGGGGSSSSGLSGGAIAGIVIGVVLFIILVAGGAYVYIKKKKMGDPLLVND